MFIVPISQMPQIGSVEGVATKTPKISQPSNLPFANVFQNVLNNYQSAQSIADQDAYKLAMGDLDDLHTVVINTEKATAALELTVQLTSKAVNAYNEIMRMQV